MNPYAILQAAVRRVPALKYALAVAGAASVVAIVLGFKLPPEIAIFGTLVVIGLMFVLVVFTRYASDEGNQVPGPAIALVWFYTVAVITCTTLFITSYFGHWPIDFRPFAPEVKELVPVTLTAVYSGSLSPASRTIFTVSDPVGKTVLQELIPDASGRARLQLRTGKYELRAVGTKENINFEVSPPETTIALQVTPAEGSESTQTSELLSVSTGSSRSAFEDRLLISLISNSVGGSPAVRKVSFTIGTGAKNRTYRLEDVGWAEQLDGFEIRLTDVTDWGAKFLVKEARSDSGMPAPPANTHETDTNVSYDGAAAVTMAKQLQSRGVHYLWGGRTPGNGMDSSGFVGYILHQQGFLRSVWPHVSSQTLPSILSQHHSATYVSERQLNVGDLIFVSNYIFIYEGSAKAIGMTDGRVRSSASAIEEIDVGTDVEPLHTACQRSANPEGVRCEVLFVRP